VKISANSYNVFLPHSIMFNLDKVKGILFDYGGTIGFVNRFSSATYPETYDEASRSDSFQAFFLHVHRHQTFFYPIRLCSI